MKRFWKYLDAIGFIVLTLTVWFLGAFAWLDRSPFWAIYVTLAGFMGLLCLACGIGYFITPKSGRGENVEFWIAKNDGSTDYSSVSRDKPMWRVDYWNGDYVYVISDKLLPPSIAVLKLKDEPVKIRIEVIGRG